MAKYIRNLNSGKAAKVENEEAFRAEWDEVYGDQAKYAYFEVGAPEAPAPAPEPTPEVEPEKEKEEAPRKKKRRKDRDIF